MDITMSRVRLASDTCDIYFTYIKVNHLLYTCSLDPFEDGILLDTPLVCMHRYCRNFTDDEEECKRQGTPTPSAREAWKRRRKKKELQSLQRPDDRKPPDVRPSTAAGRPTTPDVRQVPGTGRPTLTGNPVPPVPRRISERPTRAGRPVRPEPPDVRPPPVVRYLPVCSRGPLALYPSPTYPFVAKTINRPPPPPF